MGPITIFDKSALQALSMDEAVWFEAFFSANVTPLFYVETLADLEKQVAAGRTPESLVGELAEKTPSDAYPNVHHRSLISAELQDAQIEMSGRVIVSQAEWMLAPDGTAGIHVDEFPEAVALLRWRNGEFLDLERAAAQAWRADLAAHDPDLMVGVLKNILPTGTRVGDLVELKRLIDTFCASNDKAVLALALDVLGVPTPEKKIVLERWEAEDRPSLDAFAPYATHVFKVDLLYYLGIHRGFISGERASNKVDMAYLYYLPFAMVMASGDKLHQRTAPLFLSQNQSYVQSDALKTALGELDAHYDSFPEEVKELGVLQFAHYPPSTINNRVTQLWDKHMRPDWRELARGKEAAISEQRDEARERETVSELLGKLEAAQPLTGADAGRSSDEADYAVIRRQVPFTKGKWRMVSKEVEDADDAD
jgi:hypothetical protein